MVNSPELVVGDLDRPMHRRSRTGVVGGDGDAGVPYAVLTVGAEAPVEVTKQDVSVVAPIVGRDGPPHDILGSIQLVTVGVIVALDGVAAAVARRHQAITLQTNALSCISSPVSSLAPSPAANSIGRLRCEIHGDAHGSRCRRWAVGRKQQARRKKLPCPTCDHSIWCQIDDVRVRQLRGELATSPGPGPWRPHALIEPTDVYHDATEGDGVM